MIVVIVLRVRAGVLSGLTERPGLTGCCAGCQSHRRLEGAVVGGGVTDNPGH